MSLILPIIVLIPIVFLVPLAYLGREHAGKITIACSIIVLLLSAFAIYSAKSSGYGSVSFSVLYISQFNLSFNLALTNITAILLAMTAILFVAVSTVGYYFIREREQLYGSVLLISEMSALGIFLAGNLFLFYVFWEITEVMMFFIIFIYGGYNKRYASIKFIIYSIMSSLLLLIAIMLIYSATPAHSFDIAYLISNGSLIPQSTQIIVMVLLLLSFMIKMPIFPFHSWLPDAHTEAPTTGSMILAGILLKFGGYGLILMFLMLPVAATYAPYMAAIFAFSAIYSAIAGMRQTNMKKLIAYTSITDMGIIGVGIAASTSFNNIGLIGGTYAMMSHALAISILFLIAGTMDEVYGTLEISKITGVMKSYPLMAYLFIAGVFATIGIPLTAGFIGDVLIFIGAYGTFGALGLIPIFGIMVIAAALIWLFERSFLKGEEAKNPYRDIDKRVPAGAIVLLASLVVLGVLPFLLLNFSLL